jgi:single-strand DNA-binding protein
MYTTEIKVDGFDGKMQMLGGGDGGKSDGQKPPQQSAPKQNQPAKPQTEPDFDFDDDVPF